MAQKSEAAENYFFSSLLIKSEINFRSFSENLFKILEIDMTSGFKLSKATVFPVTRYSTLTPRFDSPRGLNKKPDF